MPDSPNDDAAEDSPTIINITLSWPETGQDTEVSYELGFQL